MAAPETAPRVLVDGVPAAPALLHDRALAYGDGVFETIRIVGGRAPLWSLHLRRLRQGLGRLRIAVPPERVLHRDVHQVAGAGDCVVKLIVARQGGRGYAPHSATGATRFVLHYAPPDDGEIDYADGMRVRWCRLRLSPQPAVAGLKHLNRLEQVLARGEWRDTRIHEGLLRDADGHVVCATAANLFIVHGGMLSTPRLDRCGVVGVARAWTLAQARQWRLPVRETLIETADVDQADEVFLTNAVRGIVPVRAIGTRRFAVGPVAQRLGYTLAALGIGRPPLQNA